uniref:Uncharacterized protein n=1 Tax=Eutreptiella gymnastica TaxID=73025 RepID=A0A6T2CZQ1_9EUGL
MQLYLGVELLDIPPPSPVSVPQALARMECNRVQSSNSWACVADIHCLRHPPYAVHREHVNGPKLHRLPQTAVAASQMQTAVTLSPSVTTTIADTFIADAVASFLPHCAYFTGFCRRGKS